ncbi:GntR family transcriptional regulator [Spiroplasma apis]|uniref:HTH gntR-type domain-containing protein n=1 Tax=Spiroplasma apis B31 TaxID=1276258 RepID=V5RJJ4_SPIAP|nr:GntR family transcriptional regulator [Spiroplasma apis]AHB36281.1 hypothetical protein SAPIS_v1c04360 [Spiroplasma apis B31]
MKKTEIINNELTLIMDDKNEHKTIKSWIYKTLKNNIIELVIKPNQKISEFYLSQQFKVSRIPIREVLTILENEGLVEVLPQKGTFVKKISLQEIHSGIFFRKAIEAEVLFEIVESTQNYDLSYIYHTLELMKKYDWEKNNDPKKFHYLDNEFHRQIFKLVYKEYQWDKLDHFVSGHTRIRFLELFDKKTIVNIINQHEEELEIIIEKNKDKIRDFLSRHTSNFIDHLNNIIKLDPDMFE